MSSEDHQVGPGQLVAVFLLNRPEQSSGLVEVCIVWPTIQGSKALRSLASATASVANAVGTCAVPRHADEERTVVPVVSWPPVLRGGHDLFDVLANGVQIECQELSRIVKICTQRIRAGWVLLENVKVELVGPPMSICSATS